MKTAIALLATLSLGSVPLISQEEPQPSPAATAPEPAQAPVPEPSPPTPPEPVQPTGPAVVTLGEFAIRAASGLGIQPPPTGFTPEGAAWSLFPKGIKLRPDLAAPLTEADVVDALTQLGFKIRTTTPSRVVSRDRFEILCKSFLTPVPTPAATPSTPAAPDSKP